ncbi:MAG TPA: S-layer homology domain-containing protein [Thermoleophilia bacterium]|nr:S-layer homology domain-containing protein [Thermoleophilia bacterium]
MRIRSRRDSEPEYEDGTVPSYWRRRRLTAGRILLNLVVVAAFAAAVAAVYMLVQNSGIIDRTSDETTSSTATAPTDYVLGGPIDEAVTTGLMSLSGPSRFGPTESVSRGEFAGVVVRTMGWDVAADEAQDFADVVGDPEVLDEADYIAAVAARAVMRGTGGVPAAFMPDQPVMVGHVLVVFARAAGDALPEATEVDPSLLQVRVDDETLSAYRRLAAAGILADVSLDSADETLSNDADRQQVAVMAVNLKHFLAQ